jgi:hypothetical protein
MAVLEVAEVPGMDVTEPMAGFAEGSFWSSPTMPRFRTVEVVNLSPEPEAIMMIGTRRTSVLKKSAGSP